MSHLVSEALLYLEPGSISNHLPFRMQGVDQHCGNWGQMWIHIKWDEEGACGSDQQDAQSTVREKLVSSWSATQLAKNSEGYRDMV